MQQHAIVLNQDALLSLLALATLAIMWWRTCLYLCLYLCLYFGIIWSSYHLVTLSLESVDIFFIPLSTWWRMQPWCRRWWGSAGAGSLYRGRGSRSSVMATSTYKQTSFFHFNFITRIVYFLIFRWIITLTIISNVLVTVITHWQSYITLGLLLRWQGVKNAGRNSGTHCYFYR